DHEPRRLGCVFAASGRITSRFAGDQLSPCNGRCSAAAGGGDGGGVTVVGFGTGAGDGSVVGGVTALDDEDPVGIGVGATALFAGGVTGSELFAGGISGTTFGVVGTGSTGRLLITCGNPPVALLTGAPGSDPPLLSPESPGTSGGGENGSL